MTGHYSDQCVARLAKAQAASWVAMARKLAARRATCEPLMRASLNHGVREDIANIKLCIANAEAWEGVTQ